MMFSFCGRPFMDYPELSTYLGDRVLNHYQILHVHVVHNVLLLPIVAGLVSVAP